MMAWWRGGLAGLALGLNTVAVFALMLPPALVKLLVPVRALRPACDRALNALASGWVGINNAWLARVGGEAWEISGLDDLNPRGWYLVASNHRSWADILVLQRVLHRRVPFLKFFLKRELIWVPVIGLAWWALDFPFMQRGRRTGSGRSDLAATRLACEKFRRTPTAIINFAEGTRFSAAKHAAQRSPYRHLLLPKAGGLVTALETMGPQLDGLLDVTLVYPDGTPRFWDLLCGRAGRVCVHVRRHPVPGAMRAGAPAPDDPERRQRVRAWVSDLWREKDRLIEAELGRHLARPAATR